MKTTIIIKSENRSSPKNRDFSVIKKFVIKSVTGIRAITNISCETAGMRKNTATAKTKIMRKKR